MEINLIPTGKLDIDSDAYSLAEGDYPNARNIVISTSKLGGRNVVKTLESIKSVGLSSVSGTLKAITVAANGEIYQLYENAGTALIYKINNALTTRTLVLQYTHNVSSDFTPDIKCLGTSLFWNYYASGTPLMWNTSRANGTTVLLADIAMAKYPPVSILTITKSIDTANSIKVLELENFQFATSYRFDNGEVSVLSPFTSIFKAETGTQYYTVLINIVAPTSVTEIDIYARSSSGGSWRRIRTVPSASSGTATFNWKGEYFETLPDALAAVSFSAVPTRVGSIEVALDRVWFGDFDDDYADNGSGDIVITVSNGYSLPSGGTIKNYLGASTTSAGIKSSESGTYYKPFANNSQYLVGVAFFDSSLKTRGVEFAATLKTGQFAAPFNPVFNLSTSGYVKPPWAKYMQLCISQNLAKIFSYEGYANSIYFEVEQAVEVAGVVKTEINKVLSVATGQETKVKSCVLDVSGIYKAGHIYTYNQGDKCDFRCPNAAGDGYRILTTNIIRSDGDKIYLEWNGGLCTNNSVPVASELYFEIYSPIQVGENNNQLLYSVGDFIDVTNGIPSTVTDYKIGDSVWKTLSFKENTEVFATIGYGRSVPAIVVANAETTARTVKDSSDVTTVVGTDSNLSQRRIFPIALTTVTNTYTDTIPSGQLALTGYYDSYTLSFDAKFNLLVTSTGGNTKTGSVNYDMKVVRAPYNQETASFESDVILIRKSSSLYLDIDDFNQTTGIGDLLDISFIENFSSSKEIHKISAGDRLKVIFEVEAIGLGGNTLDVALKNKTGVTDSVTLKIVGSRIAPVVRYYKKDTVTLAASDTVFAVRSSSFNALQPLTSSSGKPYLQKDKKQTGAGSRYNSFRHGGNYIQGTNSNNLSMFSVLDTYDVPEENGKIMGIQRASRIQGDGSMLLILCENEVSYALLGEVNFEGAGGDTFSALSTNLVGSIRTIEETTGIQDRRSVFNNNGVVFWWDNKQSKVFTLNKGVKAISDIAVSSYFLGKSGIAKFAFDPFYSYLFVNVGGVESIAFDVKRNEWKAFFDINFDFAVQKGNRCIYFVNGLAYRSLESASGNKFNEFMGSTYNGRIDLLQNTIEEVIPLRVQVNHNMVVADFAQANFVRLPLFEINITNENGQASTILTENFLFEQNKLYAYVLRDSNSSGGIVNGNFIIGYNNIFSLILKNNTIENRIFALTIDNEKNA